MNELNLEHINARSPYKVWRTLRENELNFLTDGGVLYGVGFSEEMEIAGITSYQFSFARLNATHSGFDALIKQTLMAIIDEFFRANNEIMIYICDTSDGREAYRSRLFMRWFEESDESSRFTIRSVSTEIEGQGFYTALIIENANPHIKEILEDFESTAKVLCEK